MKKTVWLFLFAVFCQLASSQQNGELKMYEKTITIPTYLMDAPEQNPIFYTPKDYQGAQNRIYPYVFLDKLTDKKVDKEYKGLFLENEYIKICVLPELGGRLYMAQDKTNG